MDYKLIAYAVTNGTYTHGTIAMALRALEILDAPQAEIDSIEELLYGLKDYFDRLEQQNAKVAA